MTQVCYIPICDWIDGSPDILSLCLFAIKIEDKLGPKQVKMKQLTSKYCRAVEAMGLKVEVIRVKSLQTNTRNINNLYISCKKNGKQPFLLLQPFSRQPFVRQPFGRQPFSRKAFWQIAFWQRSLLADSLLADSLLADSLLAGQPLFYGKLDLTKYF